MEPVKGKQFPVKRNRHKASIAQIIPRVLLLIGVVAFLKLLLRKRALVLDTVDAAAVPV